MQKLNEFLGQIMTSVAQARQMADIQSASLSEDYHADDMLQGMPIPHYTINEAEVSVPVMVVGVSCQGEDKEDTVKRLTDMVQSVLPQLYYRTIKNCYYDKQKRLAREAGETDVMERKLSDEPELKERYQKAAEKIADSSTEHFRVYLEEANLEMQRLIDITEAFIDIVYKLTKVEFSAVEEADNPFYDKADMKAACYRMGKRMRFEFKEVFKSLQGVMIEPSTSKMNEYASENFLLQIKMKLKEQDLDFVVEKDEKSGENKRFLSLT